jgi:hypothetical protein
MTEKEAINKIMNGNVIDVKKDIEQNFSTAFVGAGIGYVYMAFSKGSKLSGLLIGGILGYFVGKMITK